MFRPRIIPCLLLDNSGLVKTTCFENPNYIGDPINTVKIFNELKADELIFLDITAGKTRSTPKYELLEQISEEAYMPFSTGGGIRNIEQAKNIFNSGSEKVILNTCLYENPNLISEIAGLYGSQAIVASIDVKLEPNGEYSLWSNGGLIKQNKALENHIEEIQLLGVGEIFINSIDRDGTFQGYDNVLVRRVSNLSDVPVIVCGGASDIDEFRTVVDDHGASACAAGSIFIYLGSMKAVMINYPEPEELLELFG